MRIMERRDVLLILLVGAMAAAVWYIEQPTRPPGPKLRLTLAGAHAGGITGVVFSPDGKILVSAGWDQTIRLWNTDSGSSTRLLMGHLSPIRALAFSPRGRLVAAGGGRGAGELRLWDVVLGQETAVLVGPGGRIERTGEVHTVAFSPDGRLLASGSSTLVHIWEVDSGELIATLRNGAGQVQSIAFSPDGRTLASGGVTGTYDGAIVLWDSATFAKTAIYEDFGPITSLAFSTDGTMLASASTLRSINVREISSGNKMYFRRDEDAGNIPAIAFRPEGRTLAWGTKTGAIRILNLEQRGSITSVEGHQANILAVAFSPAGQILASGDANGVIKLWQFSAR